jgi:hypothetical protein
VFLPFGVAFVEFRDKIMAADVSPTGARLVVGTAHALFETQPYRGSGSPFDVTGDGQ